MPIFKCPKCSYTTKRKCHIIQHQNKKGLCKDELVIYDQNEPVAQQGEPLEDDETIGSMEGHLLEINNELEKVKNEKIDLFNELEAFKEKYQISKKQINKLIKRITLFENTLNELGYEIQIK